MIRLSLSIFWQEHHRNDVSFSVHDTREYIMLIGLITGDFSSEITLIVSFG